MYYIMPISTLQDICYYLLMNVVDYVKWRGDIPFSIDPFNNVDGLVFSLFAYNSFDTLFKGRTSLTIEQLTKSYLTNKVMGNTIMERQIDDNNLIYQLSKSLRFKDLIVHNYVSIFHSLTTEQFAALMIDLPNNITVVSFRGTDNTLTGWNEDFELSYKEVQAQYDAVDYINNNARLFRKYILVGHSKGGHLALYAAMHCNKSIQKRILKVISNDGPGLRTGTFNNEDYNAIKDRFVKIVPEFDVVGSIFDTSNNKIVIQSDAKGLGQHSGITWQIEKNDFVKTTLDNDSILLSEVINNFLSKTSEEDRKKLTKDLFMTARNCNIRYISDINIKTIIDIVRNTADMSKDSKDIANLLFKEFVAVFGNNFIEEVKDVVNKTRKQIKSRVKKKQD